MAVTQKNREIQVFTPLGEDVLLFYQMHGRESLSEPYGFELELLSENPSINPDKLLGENIAVGIVLPDGSMRYFNGFVTRFGHYGNLDVLAYYRATIRPWLWFLTRASNCRIFQNKTAVDIIKQVFRDQGFSDFKEKLSGSYASREYCVQYRETDFNFVSRLMEDEGIYYYFTHEKGKHFLVMTDSPSGHSKFPGYENIPFHTEEGSTDRTRADHIYDWGFAKEVQLGAYELTDYDFKKPKANLLVKSKIKESYSHADLEYFDFPGRYTETGVGDNFVRHRIEEHHARFERCEGHCNARGLSVGYLFNLKDNPRKEQNREYLVLAATYSLRMDAYFSKTGAFGGEKTFDCSFTAADSKQPFRPSRSIPKPLVHGAQTAVVVGPAGEEIYTDKYGRVKVHFHWDRKERWESGKQEQDSSCWIRVSHPWAGKQWGSIYLPRIGQEVIVDFLEGDPDQPIIIGRVYNDNQMPPYTLPANMTQSGIKTRSSKGGGPDNYNEIRFEDKKGQEEIHIQAERNLTTVVEANESRSVGGSRTTTIHKKDETLTIKEGNRTETLEKGNDTLSIKQGNRSTTLDKGNDTLKVSMGNITIEAPAGKYSVSAKDVEITGTASVKIVCGGSSIEMTPASITIKSTTIEVNGSAMTTVKGGMVKINC